MTAAVLAAAGCAAAAGAAAGAEPAGLELLSAWSVEGPDNFQPSGLAWRDGVLYVVSDKHSDTIFRVEWDGAVARCVPAVTFRGPWPLPGSGWLDLEAIVAEPGGGFLLASEEAVRLLRVPAGGGEAAWITPGLAPAGRLAGLFAQPNACTEGLALLGPDRFLAAAEREPRGLIEIDGSGGVPEGVSVRRMVSSAHPVPAGRNPDFADLAVWRGRVFALARNQMLVVELVRDAAGGWREGAAAWSYAAAEEDPQFGYGEAPWGMAEGLAIGDEAVHIVLDNGAQPRAGRPEDRRPWLWAFRNPEAGRGGP